MAKKRIGAVKLRVKLFHSALARYQLTTTAGVYQHGGTSPPAAPDYSLAMMAKNNAALPAGEFMGMAETAWDGHPHIAKFDPPTPYAFTSPFIDNGLGVLTITKAEGITNSDSAVALAGFQATDAGIDLGASRVAKDTIHPVTSSLSAQTWTIPDAMKSQGPFTGTTVSGSTETITIAGSVLRVAYATAVADAVKSLGTTTGEHASGDPALERPSGQYKYSRGANYKFEGGDKTVEKDAPIYVFMDTTSKALSFSASLDDGDATSALGKANAAKEAYQKQLVQAMADKASGITPTLPSPTRPIDTTSSDLGDDKKFFDDWWRDASAARERLVSSPLKTADEAYAAYQAAGGTKSKADYLAALATAKTAASGKDDTSWLSTLGTGLGIAADKTGSLLSDLTGKATDLLKSWGPMGTVGAYSGIKAVNAAGSGDFSKLLLYGGLAAAAILIIK